MTLSADALLVGPRGRHLCLSVAHRLYQPVWATWLQAAWHPTNDALRAELISALAEVEPGPIRTWRPVGSLTGAVGDSVDRAMYWQSPDDQDVVAAIPDVIDALRPIAEAIAVAPGSQWWDSSIDLKRQRYSSLHEASEPADEPDRDSPADNLTLWKQRTAADEHRSELERPADPAAPYGGYWWSTPTGSGLLRTTRQLPDSGTAQLFREEDSFGQHHATIWRTRTRDGARIYEIDGPRAWTDLVERYPLDVSWGRRHTWYQVTGRAGQWLIPDWEAVSHDWDAVHLTVSGYLATATRCLMLDRTTATMLAGFDPDETFWLTDASTIDDSEPQRWTKLDSFGSLETEWQLQDPQR